MKTSVKYIEYNVKITQIRSLFFTNYAGEINRSHQQNKTNNTCKRIHVERTSTSHYRRILTVH